MGLIVTVLSIVATLVWGTVSSVTSCEYQPFRPSSQNDGYLMSPNYPELYSPGSCLTWIYYGRPGMQITIRILDMDIPSYSATCSNDFLMVGPNNEQTYCGSSGSKSFELYQTQLTSQQNWLYVAFNSTNVGAKGRGFKLHYQFSNPSDISSLNTSVKTLNTTPSTVQPWDEQYNHASNCQFVLTSRSGFFSTNSTVLNCLEQTGQATWLILSPGPATPSINYELHFVQCYLPYPDSLKIYDGYTNRDHIVSYSNSICSSYMVSSHHGFIVEYKRQATESFPSFIMQFVIVRSSPTVFTEIPQYRLTTAENPVKKVSDKCMFQLSDQSGEISSDTVVGSVHNTGYCSWLLYMPATEGHQVIYSLNFEIFKLSPNSIFKVYDGANVSAPTLGTFSMLMPPFSLTSSQNRVFMHYSQEVNFQSAPPADVFSVKYTAYVRCALGFQPCGYGEFSCYREENRCDGIWNCPLHGGDERGCSAGCPTEFSCDFRSANCYTEKDRCNGKGTCSNYMDEMACNEDKCSASKGLYLCRNGRCIYEKWRCDRMNDCFDNSDEEDCSTLSSPRVIVAAIIGSLSCALLLVIAVGCVCKVYRIRARQLLGGLHHETPLSRQLAEMFHHRAPPPPYHEAMLTSRPYDEAYLELLGQTEHNLEASDVSNDHSANLSPPRERPQRNHRQSRRCRHNQRYPDQNSNQHQSSETERLVEIESLPLLLEVFEDNATRPGVSSSDPVNSSEPPPYSECDSANIAGSCCSDSEDDCSDNEAWCVGGDNAGYIGDEDSHTSIDRESVIQMEAIQSTRRRPNDHSSMSSGLRNSNGVRAVGLEENFTDSGGEDSRYKDVSASTSLSADSSRIAAERASSKLIPAVGIIDEDSDSDCILDGNNADDTDDDDTDSDTPCILDQA